MGPVPGEIRGKAVNESTLCPVDPRLLVHGFGLFKRNALFNGIDSRDMVNESLCAIVPPSVVFPEGIAARASPRKGLHGKFIALRLPRFGSAGFV